MERKEIIHNLSNILGRRINITTKIPISLDEKSKTLKLHVNVNGLVDNMQKDGSSVDSLAICLKAILYKMIEKVEISWDNRTPESFIMRERRHYYRFLYRMVRFKQNFNWVILKGTFPGGSKNFENEISHWVSNYPNGESQTEARGREHIVEREICDLIQKRRDIVGFRQLPIGLFKERVEDREETSRTPGGGSGMDLWSIKDKTLTIYELKVNNNKRIGIISELCFYVYAMHDLSGHVINYPQGADCPYRKTNLLIRAINNNEIEQINATLLFENAHPLITQEVISLLNTNKSGIRFACQTVQELRDELLS